MSKAELKILKNTLQGLKKDQYQYLVVITRADYYLLSKSLLFRNLTFRSESR